MLSLLLLAATVIPPVAPLKPTSEARAAFWRAQFEATNASVAFEAAKKRLSDTVAALCVAPIKPTIGADGEPTCEASAPGVKK